MTLLFTYVFVALGFSFLCSIAEAVLLSVSAPYIALLEKEGKKSGAILRRQTENINRPLAAILTLNTIAHTIGAAGAGAQAATVFGSGYVGIASAVLTLLILVFSEIIPKTLGAHYWRKLAPITAHALTFLIWTLYPFVYFSEKLTRGLAHGPTLRGFSRAEFAAVAELGAEEGELALRESRIFQNLLLLRETRIKDAMTPRTVVFSLAEDITVEAFCKELDPGRFSRIPIYREDSEKITGYVLRSELALAQVNGHANDTLAKYRRDLPALLSSMTLMQAFDEIQRQRTHIILAVDEYGGVEGILTLEDVLETLLGLEIVDEKDTIVDMQQLARRLWKHRARKLGIAIDGLTVTDAADAVDKKN